MSYMNLFKNSNAINNHLLKYHEGGDAGEITIELQGLGEGVNNFVAKLALHYGSQEGDGLFDEVFLNGASNTDFLDIRFFDENDKMLKHKIHSTGNYDFIKDSSLYVYPALTLSNGNIVASTHESSSGNIVVSSDNGQTWTTIAGLLWLMFIDSNDNIYGYRTSTKSVYKLSASDNYASLTVVKDLSALVNGSVGPVACGTFPSTWCEDASGNIYFGTYQSAYYAEIFKSTDGGNTFSSIYFSEENQHIHSVKIDPFTSYIYAGVDASRDYIKNVRSTDGGSTWTELNIPYYNKDYGLTYFGDGFRLGHGEAANVGGITIYKTTDDESFTPVLNTMQGVRTITKIGNMIVAGGNAARVNRQSQIYVSFDNGDTWETAFAENWTGTPGAGDGPRWFTKEFTPAGSTESQMLVGGLYSWSERPDLADKPIRIFQGGDRHYALVYVDVGSLPSTGKIIKLKYGYTEDYVNRSVLKEIIPSENLLLRLPLDEGYGLIVEESVSNRDVSLSGGCVWVDEPTRRFGHIYPYDRYNSGNGIEINWGYITVDSKNILPERNFTFCFWANLGDMGRADVEHSFVFGNPNSVHLTRIGISIRIYDGNGNYINAPIFSIPIETDSWNFYALAVNNDEIPSVDYYINEFYPGNVTSEIWNPSDVSGNTYMGGSDSMATINFKISDIMVFNKHLSAKELRKIYFGYDYL